MVGKTPAQDLGPVLRALRHPARQSAQGVSAYVSSQGLQSFIERQRMAAAWLKDMEAYNAQDDIIISLEDAVKASIANPTNRRHELIVRATKGFSDVADEMGYVGLFFTWTAPNRFHQVLN